MKDQLFYVKKGQEALRKAIKVLESKEGWKVEITEVGGIDMKFLGYLDLCSAERVSAPLLLLLEQRRCHL